MDKERNIIFPVREINHSVCKTLQIVPGLLPLTLWSTSFNSLSHSPEFDQL